MKQMMSMMRQLPQAKSAGGGQQKEGSGGNGRGAVNDDSGGTGRTPREENATGTGVDVAAAATAGERGPSPSSRASDRSARAGDNSRRRPEVPAGVDPTTRMQNSGDYGDVPVPPAAREAPAAAPANGAGGGAEGNLPVSSASSKKIDVGNCSTSSSSGGDSGDFPRAWSVCLCQEQKRRRNG